jgi:ABC-type multidrug transport system permease subunit
MTILHFMTAVLGANLLTAMCIYGFLQVTREEREGREYSWLALGCVLFPFAMFLAGMISAGYSPTWLGAVAAQ